MGFYPNSAIFDIQPQKPVLASACGYMSFIYKVI